LPVVTRYGQKGEEWFTMTESHSRLRHLLTAFDRWADESADRRNDGWPTDYPEFNALVETAARAMRDLSSADSISDDEVAAIARVWSLSEEPESMADAAASMGPEVMTLLSQLYLVGDVSTRWQVMRVMPRMQGLGIDLIQRATHDPDAYVRRRAWQALKEVEPSVARAEAVRALETEGDADVRTLLVNIARGLR
jgi:hypothetical protein